jgi:dTDP-4-dehydrorhamnose reductase
MVQQVGTQWDIIALARSPGIQHPKSVTPMAFDLCETNRLRQLFSDSRPHALIHTAALANIDYCQSHPDEAGAVNVEATRRLAECCRKYGTRMVFCSTDTVFDGTKGMYVEEDLPSPINVYAQTKVDAEQIVRAELEDAVVARLALVIGFPLRGLGNSFLANIIASFRQEISVPMSENEVRTPIDVITLGRALLELAESDFTGVLHLAGNTRLSRYDLAVELATYFGFPRRHVTRTNSQTNLDRAPRPNDASLNNTKAKEVLTTRMLSLQEGLRLISENAEK